MSSYSRKTIKTVGILELKEGVNECDQNLLCWKCPKCGHQHRYHDVHEWLGGEDGECEIDCEECEFEGIVSIGGHTSFSCHQMIFDEYVEIERAEDDSSDNNPAT